MNRRWLAAGLLAMAAVLLLLWLARAAIISQAARSYFREHGITAAVDIGTLGLSGVSARFALGPPQAPDISAERIELKFSALHWLPYVTEVRLVGPVVRAKLDEHGKLNLGSLQGWIESLSRQQGKSRFVSDDLSVSLTGLRLLLATPAGAMEWDGDVQLRKSVPVSARLKLQPAALNWQGAALMLRQVRLDYHGGTLHAHLAGDVQYQTLDLKGLESDLVFSDLLWSGSALSASGGLQAAAQSLNMGERLEASNLELTAQHLSLKGQDVSADLDVRVGAGIKLDTAALRKEDPPLAKALADNLARLTVAFAAHVEKHGTAVSASLTAPLTLQGAKAGTLRLSALALSASPDGVKAAFQAHLGGGGLPNISASVQNLLWSGGGLTANANVTAHFNFAMLRGAVIGARGLFSWQDGRYAFLPAGCATATLATFHPGASDLAKDVRATLCPVQGRPLITGQGAAWTLSGEARQVSTELPLANVQLENAAARLVFEGEGGPRRGSATIEAAEISDRSPNLRFKPLLASGTAALGQGVWQGRFALTDQKKTALGEVTFHHALASGVGSAQIAAPHIAFALDKLQPADLSPLFVALRRAKGDAAFSGEIDWTRQAIASRGKLSIANLDFLTPLGEAHAVKTQIDFTSLLPPVTAPGQSLTISRIDWTLPLTAASFRFGFSPQAVTIAKADTDIAQGHASLGAMTLSLANPGRIAGVAQISSIALNSLITASNLGSKVKLDGKVSGHIPFALGAGGFRITAGHIAADAPGRLSVDRSLWMQGEAAISSNAVQDFAYQALEHLAFDSLSADLNSVANGRLQIVFHIKGHSDPPQHQTADVAIADILNGTALYKPIPLPSGTPIDLTLDTSLNFDELLKSYAEAWSKSLNPAGRPEGSGAK